jgi:hypothetical protein
MSTTIRMRRCGADQTLNGYIFSDHKHAREWLSQSFVNLAEVMLEEVEVGPTMPCQRCGGSGSHRVVKPGRRLSAEEVAAYGGER